MRFPTCIKVDQSAHCIGRLETWRGKAPRNDANGVRVVAGRELLALARDIQWSGRLWRDLNITRAEALQETLHYVEAADCLKLKYHEAGFGMFEQEGDAVRILLIGVKIGSRKKGVARALISEACRQFPECTHLIAGTYHDNQAAQRLYMSLGMKIVKTELVYHQW